MIIEQPQKSFNETMDDGYSINHVSSLSLQYCNHSTKTCLARVEVLTGLSKDVASAVDIRV